MKETVTVKLVAGMASLVAALKLLAGGIDYYAQGDYPKALASFQQILDNHSPTPYADDACYWAGRCHLQLGQSAEAGRRFRQVLADHPASEYAASAKAGVAFAADEWKEANLAQVGPWDYYSTATPRATVASTYFAARNGDLAALAELLVPAAREELAVALKTPGDPKAIQRLRTRHCAPVLGLKNFRLGPVHYELQDRSRATVELVYTDARDKSSIRQVGLHRHAGAWLMQTPF